MSCSANERRVMQSGVTQRHVNGMAWNLHAMYVSMHVCNADLAWCNAFVDIVVHAYKYVMHVCMRVCLNACVYACNACEG